MGFERDCDIRCRHAAHVKAGRDRQVRPRERLRDSAAHQAVCAVGAKQPACPHYAVPRCDEPLVASAGYFGHSRGDVPGARLPGSGEEGRIEPRAGSDDEIGTCRWRVLERYSNHAGAVLERCAPNHGFSHRSAQGIPHHFECPPGHPPAARLFARMAAVEDGDARPGAGETPRGPGSCGAGPDHRDIKPLHRSTLR
jgi:hypothetical protein